MISRGQILQVKIQTAFDACGMNVLIASLDSRMSTLDYTLGMISNVLSQFFAGFQTQEWTGQVYKDGNLKPNPSESSLYITFNKVYPYFKTDWLNFGRYMMLFFTGLMNF